jgi:hypothetical protein
MWCGNRSASTANHVLARFGRHTSAGIALPPTCCGHIDRVRIAPPALGCAGMKASLTWPSRMPYRPDCTGRRLRRGAERFRPVPGSVLRPNQEPAPHSEGPEGHSATQSASWPHAPPCWRSDWGQYGPSARLLSDPSPRAEARPGVTPGPPGSAHGRAVTRVGPRGRSARPADWSRRPSPKHLARGHLTILTACVPRSIPGDLRELGKRHGRDTRDGPRAWGLGGYSYGTWPRPAAGIAAGAVLPRGRTLV